ncbi:Glycerol-1-phosphate dehydrogenase [NAD(P)+] [Metallosphaera sp. J1]|uniref:NAD(P)-dependent glycerol-1-phosphate dehydrogenase n=1 Tax=Metallosphaera javensis (ex Hofmann et al. 2022) TaxID=99938 RepID=UPI001EE00A04|nr:NAD(P)-dependent glycerol-1-phosphate dehydrogenase [Metallosphaera javensis (ex Hofmann et al. 2022)]MCG3107905.1 Glycerol-1-phosphate dehydrogenase [NAD(P)+] [Metallosphaera javensis (ex Hofmann et al. 2022)]
MEIHEHIIELPKKVYVGNGILSKLRDYLFQLSVSEPVLVVTGPNVRKIVIDEIAKGLNELGMIEFVEVMDSSVDEVNRVEEKAKELNPRFVLGIGGGKTIDVAKYVAYKLNVNFISIPTAPSHDGITSPFASIKGLGKPVSVKAKMPYAIIADINVLSSAPRRLINAGIGDTIGKLVAVRDWKLASKLTGEYYGDYTASLALLSAKHALSCTKIIHRDLKYSVSLLTEALISSGVAMGMAGSTRPASGSEHLFAHAVDLLQPNAALHGELVGIGSIIMAYIHGINWREIRNALDRIGAPTTAKQLGIPNDVVIKALTIAHTIRPERYTILGDRGLTWSSAEKVARDTGVIE